MLDWLKKLGGDKPWKNKTGLTAKSLDLLAEDFEPLSEIDPNLTAATLRYVLDGEGADVLDQLAARPDAGSALALYDSRRGIRRDGKNPRARFFEDLQHSDPGFFVRLGKVYEAAVRQKKSALLAQFPHMTAQVTQNTFNDPQLNWLEQLLMEGTLLGRHTWPARCRPCPTLNAELLETALQTEGYSADLLVRTAFGPELDRFNGSRLDSVFKTMPGIAESAVRHKATLLNVLDHQDFKQRVYALSMMKECQVPLEAFTEKLVDMSLESSKQVREQAQHMLAEIRDAAEPLLKEKVRSGENEERINAARLLSRWDGENIRAFLEEHLATEKNKKVAQALQELVASPAPKPVEIAAEENDPLQLPPLPPIPERVPLGAETEQAWRECMEKVNEGINKHLAGKGAKHYYAKDLKPVSQDAIEKGFVALMGGDSQPVLGGLFHIFATKDALEQVKAFWQRPELQPIHLVQFLIQVGSFKSDEEHDSRNFAYGFWFETLTPVYRKTHPETGLREFAAAFAAAGMNPKRIGRGLLNRYFGSRGTFGIPKTQVWPYWMEHLDLLEQAFAPAAGGGYMDRYYHRHTRENAFDALATFPKPPPTLVPLLWDLALGPKSERPQTQRCLELLPDTAERLIPSLAVGSADTRAAAADWLGRLGNKMAIDPLLAALKREKNEFAKGTMMLALELLGAPVEQFLDRAGLLKEAKKGIAKEVPTDLKWFPFDQLPAVHWSDSGNVVEPEIVRWWIIQGFKLKSPEPGALLRRYCASIKPSQREALGQFVLDAWIAEDTAPIPRADAEARAKQHAQQMVHYGQYLYQHAQNNPQAGPAPQPLTVDQYYAQALPNMLLTPKGSAIASKGVLSVAGACVSAGAAPAVNRYLKQWYGQRAAQCKALLQMLAWVEHRTATQLMLAVGTRFRTKSIQEEANKQAEALAERKGWTVAELADRTIPSAGLDENGVMTIDYGPRQFTARLNEDLEFVLTDSDGKAIKSLPDPRKDDDEAKATEAKKMYSAAKKELKSVLTMQRDRLYEAMCTQRTWPFEDWNLYLNQHPIVRHHCQRLVWSVIQGDKAVKLFRPLPDGSLTDAADNPVEFKPEDQIRVAHECQVRPEESQTWRQHLKDYDVEPLFEQFGRPNFDLSEEKKSETELSDFQGHLLEAFKLRARATKLGYTRGQAQDGGWFFDYHKRFPTLGVEVTIEFTGNGLPEENRTVALTRLHFHRVADTESGNAQEQMTLSDVPAVLLGECWNDFRTIAAEGPGFDPDWEKKASP